MADVSSNYPANSHKAKEAAAKPAKEERPKLEKIANGVQKKRSLSKRVAETFTGDDSRTVGNFILFDVVVPAIKALISDATSQGVDRLMFGDRGSRGGSGVRTGGYTNYSRSSYPGRAVDRPADGRRTISDRARTVHDFDEVILATRGEAEAVLDQLGNNLDAYGSAAVSDLYDLVGIQGSHTDEKWGWYNLRDASVERVRNGFLLNLPRTEPIE